jgi:hypothetical protein
VHVPFSLTRQKFLDLMPAARSALIESMEDGWIKTVAMGTMACFDQGSV